MRIICAPDSFKESLTAREAAAAMARGIRKVAADADVDACPIADGGEGTVDALVAATGGELRQATVTGPLGDPVRAIWGMLGDGSTAVVEMAAAAGLALVPGDQRDPTRTTTYGVGELIRAALDSGANRVILGIGGSATTDGGCGAAQALGVRFDRDEGAIAEPITGGMLGNIRAITPLPAPLPIDVACDVTNPLTGPDGAAHIYGPQKGATAEQVEQLDRHLAHLADLVGGDGNFPGAGAAGGFGYGAVALLGGHIRRGIELVLDAVDFDRRVQGCDLCLTGEGRLDGQSLSGKATVGVAAAAKKHGVPVIALVGSVGSGVERAIDVGIDRWMVIGQGLSTDESMRRAAELMEQAAGSVMHSAMPGTVPDESER